MRPGSEGTSGLVVSFGQEAGGGCQRLGVKWVVYERTVNGRRCGCGTD